MSTLKLCVTSISVQPLTRCKTSPIDVYVKAVCNTMGDVLHLVSGCTDILVTHSFNVDIDGDVLHLVSGCTDILVAHSFNVDIDGGCFTSCKRLY
jgi:hypothetical protein